MRLAKYIHLYRRFCIVYNLPSRLPSYYRDYIPLSWSCPRMDDWTELVAQVVYKDLIDFIGGVLKVEFTASEKRTLSVACRKHCVFSTIDRINDVHYRNPHLSFFVFSDLFLK